MPTIREITVDDLADQLTDADDSRSGPTLIDVRGRDDYAAGHVPGAINIPLDELSRRLDEIPTGTTVSAICQSGRRSAQAAEQLGAAGIDAVSVAGGTNAWTTSGRPTQQA